MKKPWYKIENLGIDQVLTSIQDMIKVAFQITEVKVDFLKIGVETTSLLEKGKIGFVSHTTQHNNFQMNQRYKRKNWNHVSANETGANTET